MDRHGSWGKEYGLSVDVHFLHQWKSTDSTQVLVPAQGVVGEKLQDSIVFFGGMCSLLLFLLQIYTLPNFAGRPQLSVVVLVANSDSCNKTRVSTSRGIAFVGHDCYKHFVHSTDCSGATIDAI